MLPSKALSTTRKMQRRLLSRILCLAGVIRVQVRSLDWSSDGSMLVTCSDDGQARLWAASAAASCGTHEDAAAGAGNNWN